MIRAACLLCLLAALLGCSAGKSVVVESALGSIRGVETDGVARFLGINYAQAPVGQLRWQAPQPVEAWTGVLDASAYGPWCPQFDFERRAEGEVHSGAG